MRDLGRMMKQVQKLQAEMARVQEELASERVEAAAGGGVVRAVANLRGDIQGVTIDPAAVDPDDVAMLEDLELAALHDAVGKVRELSARTVGGIDLGGLGSLLG